MADDGSAREDRILDAAARLIAHYGYDKTTMSDIAAEAGVSKGALYLHFDSKEDLFEALVLRETERITAVVGERLEAEARLTLFGLVNHSLAALGANPVLRAIVTNDRRVLGDVVRRLKLSWLFTALQTYSVDFVRQYQAVGLVRADLDPAQVAHLFAVMRYGLLTIEEVIPPAGAPSLDAMATFIADVFQRALAPPDMGDGDQPGARAAVLDALRVMQATLARHREEKRHGRKSAGT